MQEKQNKNAEISARIKLIIDYLNVTANVFAQNLGYTRSQTVYDVINGKSAPSFDFFNKFANAEYSEVINLEWLLTGRGGMLKKNLEENAYPKCIPKTHTQKDHLHTQTAYPKERTVATEDQLSSDWDVLKENEEKNFQENVHPKMSTQNVHPKLDFAHPKCPPKIKQNSKYDTSTEKNFQQFDHPKLTTQTDHPKRPPKTEIAAHDGAIQRNYHGATYVEAGGIPLIPIDAAAGILSGDNVQVMDYECDHYVIPAFHGADFLIRVAGNSMTPRYMSGDLVACIRLAMVDFLQWNKSYIIDSAQGVLLKRVKRSEKPDHLLLISENEEYDPFEIPTSEIRGLALVVGLIRIE